MQVVKRHNDPIMLALLNMLRIASLLGFLYCMLALLGGVQGSMKTDVALYMVWFGISLLSVSLMRQGDIWGAYALGIATVAMTIYDLVRGMATVGGAALGTTVMLIIFAYLRQATPGDDLRASQH